MVLPDITYQGFSLKKWNTPFTQFTKFIIDLYVIFENSILISSRHNCSHDNNYQFWLVSTSSGGHWAERDRTQARHGLLQQAWRNMQQKLTCISSSELQKNRLHVCCTSCVYFSSKCYKHLIRSLLSCNGLWWLASLTFLTLFISTICFVVIISDRVVHGPYHS